MGRCTMFDEEGFSGWTGMREFDISGLGRFARSHFLTEKKLRHVFTERERQSLLKRLVQRL